MPLGDKLARPPAKLCGGKFVLLRTVLLRTVPRHAENLALGILRKGDLLAICFLVFDKGTPLPSWCRPFTLYYHYIESIKRYRWHLRALPLSSGQTVTVNADEGIMKLRLNKEYIFMADGLSLLKWKDVIQRIPQVDRLSAIHMKPFEKMFDLEEFFLRPKSRSIATHPGQMQSSNIREWVAGLVRSACCVGSKARLPIVGSPCFQDVEKKLGEEIRTSFVRTLAHLIARSDVAMDQLTKLKGVDYVDEIEREENIEESVMLRILVEVCSPEDKELEDGGGEGISIAASMLGKAEPSCICVSTIIKMLRDFLSSAPCQRAGQMVYEASIDSAVCRSEIAEFYVKTVHRRICATLDRIWSKCCKDFSALAVSTIAAFVKDYCVFGSKIGIQDVDLERGEVRLYRALGNRIKTPLFNRIEQLINALEKKDGAFRTNGPTELFALINLMCDTFGVHDEVVASLTDVVVLYCKFLPRPPASRVISPAGKPADRLSAKLERPGVKVSPWSPKTASISNSARLSVTRISVSPCEEFEFNICLLNDISQLATFALQMDVQIHSRRFQDQEENFQEQTIGDAVYEYFQDMDLGSTRARDGKELWAFLRHRFTQMQTMSHSVGFSKAASAFSRMATQVQKAILTLILQVAWSCLPDNDAFEWMLSNKLDLCLAEVTRLLSQVQSKVWRTSWFHDLLLKTWDGMTAFFLGVVSETCIKERDIYLCVKTVHKKVVAALTPLGSPLGIRQRLTMWSILDNLASRPSREQMMEAEAFFGSGLLSAAFTTTFGKLRGLSPDIPAKSIGRHFARRVVEAADFGGRDVNVFFDHIHRSDDSVCSFKESRLTEQFDCLPFYSPVQLRTAVWATQPIELKVGDSDWEVLSVRTNEWRQVKIESVNVLSAVVHYIGFDSRFDEEVSKQDTRLRRRVIYREEQDTDIRWRFQVPLGINCVVFSDCE